jgi:hypothetical protein
MFSADQYTAADPFSKFLPLTNHKFVKGAKSITEGLWVIPAAARCGRHVKQW